MEADFLRSLPLRNSFLNSLTIFSEVMLERSKLIDELYERIRKQNEKKTLQISLSIRHISLLSIYSHTHRDSKTRKKLFGRKKLISRLIFPACYQGGKKKSTKKRHNRSTTPSRVIDRSIARNTRRSRRTISSCLSNQAKFAKTCVRKHRTVAHPPFSPSRAVLQFRFEFQSGLRVCVTKDCIAARL